MSEVIVDSKETQRQLMDGEMFQKKFLSFLLLST